jgi:lysozyme family protein
VIQTTFKFDEALGFTIGYKRNGLGVEGGAVDDPQDPGGFTWRGITLRNWRAWLRNDSVTKEELQAAPEDQIVLFYQQNYWDPILGDYLPPGVGLGVFDMAVNAGIGASVKCLQRAVHAVDDGLLGPKTLLALRWYPTSSLIGQLILEQNNYYRLLPGWPTFREGWINRLNLRQQAMMSSFRNAASLLGLTF